MIADALGQKSWRIVFAGFAERSVRREPALADSLGRVLPASWTDARLAWAASRGGKPAGAGCAPFASAERYGFPGRLNVGQGRYRVYFRRMQEAFILACISTPTDAGLDASKAVIRNRFALHFCRRCQVTVFGDGYGDTFRSSRRASPGWAVPNFGSCGLGGT